MSSKVEVEIDGDYVNVDPFQKKTDSDYALAQQIDLLKSTQQDENHRESRIYDENNQKLIVQRCKIPDCCSFTKTKFYVLIGATVVLATSVLAGRELFRPSSTHFVSENNQNNNSQLNSSESKAFLSSPCDPPIYPKMIQSIIKTALDKSSTNQLKLNSPNPDFQKNKFTDDTEHHNFTLYHYSNEFSTEFISYQYFPDILPEELLPIVVFPEYNTQISEYEKKKHSFKTVKNGTDFMDIFEDYGIDLFRGDIKNPKVLSFVTDGNLLVPNQEHVVKIANSVVKVQIEHEVEPTNIIVTCIKGTEDMSEVYQPKTSDIDRVYKEHVCIAVYGHKENGTIVGTKQFLYFWNDMINSSGWASRIIVNQVVKKIRSITKDSAEKIRAVLGELKKSEKDYSRVTGFVRNVFEGSSGEQSYFENDYWSDNSAKVEFEMCKKGLVSKVASDDILVIESSDEIEYTTEQVVPSSTVTVKLSTTEDSDGDTNLFDFFSNIVNTTELNESENGSGN